MRETRSMNLGRDVLALAELGAGGKVFARVSDLDRIPGLRTLYYSVVVGLETEFCERITALQGKKFGWIPFWQCE